MALALAILSFFTVLIPIVVGRYVDTAPARRRETIDALLVKGDPVDVALELSRLHDEASRSPGQPSTDLRSGRAEAVPEIYDRGWLP